MDNQTCQNCNCNCHGESCRGCCRENYWGRGHFGLLRWALGLLILALTFAVGAKFGELKATLEQSGYGHFGPMGRGYMMNGYGNMYYMNQPGLPIYGGTVMMKAQVSTSTLPAQTPKK